MNEGIVEVLRKFIVDELRGGDEPEDFDNDTHLIEEEVIDSLGIMTIVTFIEQEWKVDIDADEVMLSNFQSLPAIEKLVTSKLG